MIKKTKPFMAVSMPCTEKQFEKELKPILEFLGVGVLNHKGWKLGIISTIEDGIIIGADIRPRIIYIEFAPIRLIEALGYDYEDVLKAMQLKSKQTHYKVLRPILFFAKDNVVHKETLKKYFTKKAIKAFIKDKYIK